MRGVVGVNQALRASCHRRIVRSTSVMTHLDGDTVQTLALMLEVLRLDTRS